MKSLFIFTFVYFILFQSLSAQAPTDKKSSPWSAGIFAAFDSQPYKGSGRSVRVYPSVSYRGDKLKWHGPLLQYSLIKEDTWNVSAHTLIQFAPYKENDASILVGMGDRSDTLLAGIDWTYRPLPFLLVLASLDAEAFGAYDGLQATLGLQHMIGRPWNRFSGSLGAGVLLQDQNWTQYFVGVPTDKATPSRPSHTPGDSFHPYISAQFLIRMTLNWSWFALSRVEFLDETWRDSPLIADDYRLVLYTALNYSF